MSDKPKTIIVENVLVKGYIKHPNGRKTMFEFNKDDFAAIQDRAKRILNAKVPLAKISNDPNWFQCKFCAHKDKCHAGITALSA